MSDPIITIAMPFYNSAATLELSIRSLLNQTYGDFELLLCDDGSDDLGLAIAAALSRAAFEIDSVFLERNHFRLNRDFALSICSVA